MTKLQQLRELVFASDNRACFIERDRILARLERELPETPDRYATMLATVLREVSVPLYDCDYFAGRVVEALPEEGTPSPCTALLSIGHMSFDYERLLRLGFGGILAEIQSTAAEKGDALSAEFAENAATVVAAVRDYAGRYADEAEKQGRTEMARALRTVPYGPAYDFYSALQSVWLVHMIASCYVGSRDYAFGRFDQYMLPFYEQALREGHTEEELTELLCGFFMKANEICGRATHNYECKPTLCQASKQYVNIGGECPNAFSLTVLEAARRNNMAQPQITVLLKPDADAVFTERVFEAMAALTDKLHVYHYGPIVKELVRKGIPEALARDFTYSACCTFDLNYHSFRLEYFVPVPQVFLQVLYADTYGSVEEILTAFKAALQANMQDYADHAQRGFDLVNNRRQFVLDSLLLTDSTKRCRYAYDGEAPYNVLNLFCPGVATLGDSLMVLDKLVFHEKRYTYEEFVAILQADFVGYEQLRDEIKSYTCFGNDTEVDAYTVKVGNAFLDAVDALTLKANFYVSPGFYSLEREQVWRNEIGATPNGKRRGELISENQSPTYGADKNGVTALLKSLSKLPFHRTVTGGLNLTFSQPIQPEILQSLVTSYFAMGGFHVGITVLDRATLMDAQKHPERHRSLTVRLYGFSEYFISLPLWQQEAVLSRTEYNV